MKKMNKKGFTLIELLAVIVILAIVAAVTMTVIVPMISGKNEEGAITSAKEINKAVANSCAAAGATTAYGTFNPATFVTGSLTDCSDDDGCSFKLEKTNAANFVKGMNISGDMPAYVEMTVKNCQVETATLCYTTGAFEKLKVGTILTGEVTATAFDKTDDVCGHLLTEEEE